MSTDIHRHRPAHIEPDAVLPDTLRDNRQLKVAVDGHGTAHLKIEDRRGHGRVKWNTIPVSVDRLINDLVAARDAAQDRTRGVAS